MRICPECDHRTNDETCPNDGFRTIPETALSGHQRIDPFLGKTIDNKYRLETRLGAGGYATVYRATHLQMGGDVAIKMMQQGNVGDPVAVKRFYLEAQNTHKLRHPNTVRVMDFGSTPEGDLFLVMEYLPGQTLKQLVKKEGRLSPRRTVRMMTQVLKSLGEAHSIGLVHRDVKADNVMLMEQFGEKDFVKVLDFGISKQEGSAHLTAASGTVGTPRSMAPEQWRGEKADLRTDLYALGCLFYLCLAGEHPFVFGSDVSGTTEMVAYMNAHLTTEPKSLHKKVPEVSPALARFVHRLLSKSRDERPATAMEAVAELERITSNEVLPDTISGVPNAGGAAHNEELDATAMLGGQEATAMLDAVEATRMLDVSGPSPRAVAPPGEDGGDATKMLDLGEAAKMQSKLAAATAGARAAVPSSSDTRDAGFPEPKKSNTMAIVAVVLVLAAGGAVAAVLSMGGDGDGKAKSGVVAEKSQPKKKDAKKAKPEKVEPGEKADEDEGTDEEKPDESAPEAADKGDKGDKKAEDAPAETAKAEGDDKPSETAKPTETAAAANPSTAPAAGTADPAAKPEAAAAPAEPAKPAEPPKPAPKLAKLSSNPPGAKVFVEATNAEVGTTPMDWTLPADLAAKVETELVKLRFELPDGRKASYFLNKASFAQGDATLVAVMPAAPKPTTKTAAVKKTTTKKVAKTTKKKTTKKKKKKKKKGGWGF